MASFSRLAVLEWTGDVPRGSGQITAGSDAFTLPATFPRLSGEPAGATTPEELLAASHATCFGIGLRSVLAQRGGTASQVRVTATVTAEKGGGRIRIRASHLDALVDGLAGIDPGSLEDVARAAEEACTISALLRASVPVTVNVRVGAAA
jgi:osmotically inducible protein OsmC